MSDGGVWLTSIYYILYKLMWRPVVHRFIQQYVLSHLHLCRLLQLYLPSCTYCVYIRIIENFQNNMNLILLHEGKWEDLNIVGGNSPSGHLTHTPLWRFNLLDWYHLSQCSSRLPLGSFKEPYFYYYYFEYSFSSLLILSPILYIL